LDQLFMKVMVSLTYRNTFLDFALFSDQWPMTS
jgi:hypothetical protein